MDILCKWMLQRYMGLSNLWKQMLQFDIQFSKSSKSGNLIFSARGSASRLYVFLLFCSIVHSFYCLLEWIGWWYNKHSGSYSLLTICRPLPPSPFCSGHIYMKDAHIHWVDRLYWCKLYYVCCFEELKPPRKELHTDGIRSWFRMILVPHNNTKYYVQT